MNWKIYQLRNGRSTMTCAAAVVLAAGGWMAVPTADAGQISRPIRDTSSRTVESTGKVLIAVPRGSHGYRYLYRTNRDYHGPAVRCGVGYGEPADYAIAKLATWDRYNYAYDVCDRVQPRRGMQIYRAADHRDIDGDPRPNGGRMASHADMMDGPMTVIASGQTSLKDLPAAMQNDGWALLNAGRYRDAVTVFEAQGGNDAANMAGLAIATALSGDLDAGADALADMGGNLDALRGLDVSDGLSGRLNALADTLYEDRPDAQRVLRALSGGDGPDRA